MVFCIGSRQLPVGFRPECEIGYIIIFYGIIAWNNRTALSIGGEALHGPHTDGFKQQLRFESGFHEKPVDNSAQG